MICTSLSSLIETKNVAFFLCEISRFSDFWIVKESLTDVASELSEASAQLLSFIARLGGGGGEKTEREFRQDVKFSCRPETWEERKLHKERALLTGIDKGWFSIAAQGSSEIDFSQKDGDSSKSGSSILWSPQGIGGGGGGRERSVCTRFSNEIAVSVYRITFSLLEFHLLLAKQAMPKDVVVSGRTACGLPPLPSSYVLHGIQDQVLGILTQIASETKTDALQVESRGPIFEVWDLLTGVFERSVLLESLLINFYRQRLDSSRPEKMVLAFKAFGEAVQGKAYFKDSIQITDDVLKSLFATR